MAVHDPIHVARFFIGAAATILTVLVGTILVSAWQAFGWWMPIGLIGLFMGLLLIYGYGWMIVGVINLMAEMKAKRSR